MVTAHVKGLTEERLHYFKMSEYVTTNHVFFFFVVLEYSATRAVTLSAGGGTVCISDQETCKAACEFISPHRQRS